MEQYPFKVLGGFSMECVICGKSVLDEETLKHIARLKKKPNVEKENNPADLS